MRSNDLAERVGRHFGVYMLVRPLRSELDTMTSVTVFIED